MAIRLGTFGNDTLNGTPGNDILIGLFGDDTYTITPGDILLEFARGGTDTVIAGFSYQLEDNFENLTLSGLADINGTGNAANNVITGNAGSNVLTGGAGDDTLDGGMGGEGGVFGVDSAFGGAGNDIIVYDTDDLNGIGAEGVRYDGGEGSDTLFFGATDGALNLASTTFNAIQSIERFDLSGSGNHSVLFTVDYIARLSPETRTIVVDGGAGDRVGTAPDADWIFQRFIDIDGNRYADYATQGLPQNVQLRVDTDIDRSGISVINPPDESALSARADAFAALVCRMAGAQQDLVAAAPATQVQTGRGAEPQLAGGG